MSSKPLISRKLFLSAAIATAVSLAACSPSPTPATKAPSTAATSTARNVILFIGDGMGVSTVTATRIYDGQLKGLDGEEHALAFESFPNVALVKTYNSNQQVPDSAGTATAMLTGVKTRAGMINTEPGVLRRDCQAGGANGLESLATIAAAMGKSTGVVTTARLTHATPATMYAQSAERNWESDKDLTDEELARGCRDIARQLIDDDHGAGLVVAMGGGRQGFYGPDFDGERRAANDDLPAEWVAAGDGRRYVSTVDELRAAMPGERVLGLFSASHMTYMAERDETSSEPTLTDMTERALDLLEGDPEGYFLMVEGGRIDHGHHASRPGYALTEAVEFNRAVEAALARVDLDDTLVLVTADHSHVFTMGGYATRGNPILGYVVENDGNGQPETEPALAADGQPYTVLAYANGPGAVRERPRPRPETGMHAVAQSLVPVVDELWDGGPDYDESHGGEDVALYAIGPGSEGVRGVMEQNLIYDVMRGAFDPDRRASNR